MEVGFVYALVGVAFAVLFTGVGSSIGMRIVVKSTAGVLAEKPELFGRLLILNALPTTNGIYGFLVGILILIQEGMPLGEGTLGMVLKADGIRYLMAAIPIGIVGLVAAIAQAKAAAYSVYMTGKRPETSSRGLVLSSMVETYPILALLISVLIIFA